MHDGQLEDKAWHTFIMAIDKKAIESANGLQKPLYWTVKVHS